MCHIAFRLLVTVLMALGLLASNAAPSVAQEGLVVDVTIDQATVDPRTGDVTLTGTVTCSEPAVVDVFGELRQSVGRVFTVRGFVGVFVECPGPEGTTFSVTVVPDVGEFRPGRARLIAFVFGCAEFDPVTGECLRPFFEQIETTLRLRPAR
jgi:hypothetical protein